MDNCNICKKNNANINFTKEDDSTLEICQNCFNKIMAEKMDIELAPFNNGVYEYFDENGEAYKIKCDQQQLFKKLESKIKNILSKKYLQVETYSYGLKHISIKGDEIVGRFEYNEKIRIYMM